MLWGSVPVDWDPPTRVVVINPFLFCCIPSLLLRLQEFIIVYGVILFIPSKHARFVLESWCWCWHTSRAFLCLPLHYTDRSIDRWIDVCVLRFCSNPFSFLFSRCRWLGRPASVVKEGMVLRVLSEHHLSQQVAVLLPSSITFSRPRKQVSHRPPVLSPSSLT